MAIQFGCHAHFSVLLEVPHPIPNIFSSNFDELDNLFWRVLGVMPPALHTVIQKRKIKEEMGKMKLSQWPSKTFIVKEYKLNISGEKVSSNWDL